MIVGLTLIWNESWIAAYSLRVALSWVDQLVVLLHACTDDTARIVSEVAIEHGRMVILDEPDPEFREMDLRQRCLEQARGIGGTVMAVIDADEILTASQIVPLRRRARMLPPGGVLITPILNLWRSLDQFRNDDTPFGRAWVILAFGDAPGVTWRPAEDGYQFHRRLPDGPWLHPMRFPSERAAGGVMHAQHSNWRRLTVKQAYYQAIEAVRWPHRDHAEIKQLYSATVDETGLRCEPVPPSWWAHGLDRDALIKPETVPWQEQALRDLVAEHGREYFEGLDFFGVV